MEVEDHVAALAGDARRLAEAALAAGLDAPVPTCPDWVVRDLVRHQGGVHRWATSIVGTPRTERWDVGLDEVVGAWPSDAGLIDWFSEGATDLAAVLAAADPALDCWTFLAAPSPLAMWARRQAHETAVHRVDAELAAAQPVTPFPPLFAADGIDELLRCFVTRPGRLRADRPCRLDVSCVDTPHGWSVHIGADGVATEPSAGGGDCEVRGRAADLYLALWSRAPADPLVVAGDGAVLDLFLEGVHIVWS